MAAGLILEFEGVGVDRYNAVNSHLGIDMATGRGDWPDGLLFHAGGEKDGGWAILEVWESREHQQRFFEDRLARAMQEGGVTDPPSRMEWIDLVAHHHLGS